MNLGVCRSRHHFPLSSVFLYIILTISKPILQEFGKKRYIAVELMGELKNFIKKNPTIEIMTQNEIDKMLSEFPSYFETKSCVLKKNVQYSDDYCATTFMKFVKSYEFLYRENSQLVNISQRRIYAKRWDIFYIKIANQGFEEDRIIQDKIFISQIDKLEINGIIKRLFISLDYGSAVNMNKNFIRRLNSSFSIWHPLNINFEPVTQRIIPFKYVKLIFDIDLDLNLSYRNISNGSQIPQTSIQINTSIEEVFIKSRNELGALVYYCFDEDNDYFEEDDDCSQDIYQDSENPEQYFSSDDSNYELPHHYCWKRKNAIRRKHPL